MRYIRLLNNIQITYLMNDVWQTMFFFSLLSLMYESRCGSISNASLTQKSNANNIASCICCLICYHLRWVSRRFYSSFFFSFLLCSAFHRRAFRISQHFLFAAIRSLWCKLDSPSLYLWICLSLFFPRWLAFRFAIASIYYSANTISTVFHTFPFK